MSGLTGTPVHKGSWFGLPDFGITEALQGRLTTSPSPTGLITNTGTPASAPRVTSGTPTNMNQAFASGGLKQVAGASIAPSSPPSQPSGGSGGMSLRQQMERGLVPWDDNRLAAENSNNAAAEEARRREEEARNAINSGFDEYEGRLRGQVGTYDKAQEQELGSNEKTYGSIFGGLESQKQTNLDKLEANRGQVKEREASSIKDLKTNLANVVRGMGMQLGAQGAGDTSATQVMMPYAYTKLAGNQEGGIRRQSNQQLFEIDTQEKDTEQKFSDMWRQTEVEKEQSRQNIRNYYGEAIGKVQMALANAPLERQQSLSSLAMNLLADAKSRLAAAEERTAQRQDEVKKWAVDRMGQLNNLRLTLADSANFNPQDIVFQELQMLGANPALGGGSEGFFNPMAMAQKKREEFMAG